MVLAFAGDSTMTRSCLPLAEADDPLGAGRLRVLETEAARAGAFLAVDLRARPVAELRRLYVESQAEYLPFKDKLPTQANPSGIFGKALTEAIIAEQAERDRARLASVSSD